MDFVWVNILIGSVQLSFILIKHLCLSGLSVLSWQKIRLSIRHWIGFLWFIWKCVNYGERKSGKNKSIKPETAHRQQTKWDRWKHNGQNEIDGRKKNFPIQNWNSMKNDRWGEMSVSTKICQLFNCAFILCFRKQLSCHFAVVCMDFTNPFIYQISLKFYRTKILKAKRKSWNILLMHHVCKFGCITNFHGKVWNKKKRRFWRPEEKNL